MLWTMSFVAATIVASGVLVVLAAEAANQLTGHPHGWLCVLAAVARRTGLEALCEHIHPRGKTIVV